MSEEVKNEEVKAEEKKEFSKDELIALVQEKHEARRKELGEKLSALMREYPEFTLGTSQMHYNGQPGPIEIQIQNAPQRQG